MKIKDEGESINPVFTNQLCLFCKESLLVTMGFCHECGQVAWCPNCGAFGHDDGYKDELKNYVWRIPKNKAGAG
jgi:hypothetical protein